ncbi:hypothetical protein [Kribbella sp. NBC_00889]|uniref:hypothetical protein n=1 Tax=Kribbella sp. NBC_00889 TaxID=2975974 RepID=UPI003870132D|nr:hypothetical protein OG817_38450 [Kribbella sp. NBC_00889]
MIIAIDADSRDTAAADHLLYDLLDAMDRPVVACTHMVSGGDRPHVAVSLTSTADLAQPVRDHLAGQNVGLAITRPGAELRTRCNIDHLEAVGGQPVADDALVDTCDFLRPLRRDGRLVLQLQPAAGNVLIPFELQHQQQCCADH